MVASFNVPNAFRPPPYKRRRTATGVLAGDFDWEPRDVLTSFLRGIDYHDPSLRHRSGQKSSSHPSQKSRRKAKRVEDENKLVSRVVEIWGFFWVQVLPYVEGVSAAADISLPLMMQFGIGAPSSANRSNDILPISDAKGPQTLVA